MIELTFINSVGGLVLFIGLLIMVRSIMYVFLDEVVIGFLMSVFGLWVMFL